jgi:hypothetical protein
MKTASPNNHSARPHNRGSRELVCILSNIEEMKEQEVERRIGSSKYRAIRKNDSHPMFVELLAGHEGWSTGKMGAGNRIKKPARKKWDRQRIRELASRFRNNVPVFDSHSRTGSQRRPIGEIVSAAERWTKGVLGAVGIAYIRDENAKSEIRKGALDTCSIEAEVECHRDRSAREDAWVVDAVRKVTGIALGNSRLHRPGFPAARLLAMVEEFEPEYESPGEDNRIRELEARLAEKGREVKALSTKLKKIQQEDEKEKLAGRARAKADQILFGRDVTPEEREIILEEIKRNPPEKDDVEAGVKTIVDRELEKITRLRESWKKEKIAAPPEKEVNPINPNPLIPTD